MDTSYQEFLNQVQNLPSAAMVMIAVVGLACLAIGGFLGYYLQRLADKEPDKKITRGKGFGEAGMSDSPIATGSMRSTR